MALSRTGGILASSRQLRVSVLTKQATAVLCPISKGMQQIPLVARNYTQSISNMSPFSQLLSSTKNGSFFSTSTTTTTTTTGIIGEKKISLVFSTQADGPGSLGSVLQLFHKHRINMTRIESRPTKRGNGYDFFVDFDGAPDDQNVKALMTDLKQVTHGAASLRLPQVVSWFPSTIRDIDSFSTKTLDAGAELEADHPGFSDSEYRTRRRMIVENASTYKLGQSIPRVAYTKNELQTWGVVYEKLRGYTREYAVSSYNEVLPQMEQHCGYSATNIPQLQDISGFLKSRTGFTLRPVGGLLSARDFLNGLAFRVFFSTQYIRHHSLPLYTPEPDIVHELLGHAPMFADPDFADFSHEIGLASLGASDEDIKKLATCYWFSVEFGLCMQDGLKKAYGAGLLSSFGELEYACSPQKRSHQSSSSSAAADATSSSPSPEYRHWDPHAAAAQSYPITKYQPVYYVADSLVDAKTKMRTYCEQLTRPFHVRYDPATESVTPDRAVVRGPYTVTLQT